MLQTLLSALVLFATIVSGTSVICNNCENNVTIYRHAVNNTRGIYSPNSPNVLCAESASTQFTIPAGMVSDELEPGCDVFVSFDFQTEIIFNLDGSVYDGNYTCSESPSDKMSCYDGAGISPYRTIFNIDADTVIFLCAMPLEYPPTPAPAPAPTPDSSPMDEYSVATIFLIFFGTIGIVSVVAVILFCFMNCVHRHEEKKFPVRYDIPRYDRGLAYVANV